MKFGKVHEVVNRSRVLRYTLQTARFLFAAALVICFVFFLRGKEISTNAQLLFILLFVGAELFAGSLTKSYYSKWRSKDSWLRIIGITIFTFAAAILVSAVVISLIIK
jgi:uncharacterized membrane protein YgdD (TMEM256/DUF423 family)